MSEARWIAERMVAGLDTALQRQTPELRRGEIEALRESAKRLLSFLGKPPALSGATCCYCPSMGVELINGASLCAKHAQDEREFRARAA